MHHFLQSAYFVHRFLHSVPLAMLTKLSKNRAGEQTTDSTFSLAGTAFVTSSTKLFASGSVLYIFQLPAIIGLRIICTPFQPIPIPLNNDYLSFNATTPGSSLPSINSSEAPPPVEM